jgi:hypothetical protein
MEVWLNQLTPMLNPANPNLREATAAHLALCSWQNAVRMRLDQKVIKRLRRDFFALWFKLDGVF